MALTLDSCLEVIGIYNKNLEQCLKMFKFQIVFDYDILSMKLLTATHIIVIILITIIIVIIIIVTIKMWSGGNNKLLYCGAQDQYYTYTMFDVCALWIVKV